MIDRNIAPLLLKLAGQYPVMTLTGPRQSGKTTLAKALFPAKPNVTLEDPDIRRFASGDPRGFLAQYASGAIFDEIQRAPELSSYLQDMVDANPKPGQFIFAVSQQFELMTQVTQSLAGRTGILRLLPLTLAEVQRFSKKIIAPDLPGTLLKAFTCASMTRGLPPRKRWLIIFQPMSSVTCASLPPCKTCSGLSALCACAPAVPRSC